MFSDNGLEMFWTKPLPPPPPLSLHNCQQNSEMEENQMQVKVQETIRKVLGDGGIAMGDLEGAVVDSSIGTGSSSNFIDNFYVPLPNNVGAGHEPQLSSYVTADQFSNMKPSSSIDGKNDASHMAIIRQSRAA